MLTVFPDYYKDFKCIKGECRHNCCIGWEIDIDADTAAFYKTVQGELGRRLKENISGDDEPHFILGENERCPFLNRENLCDLIIELGEDHLCCICADHPRFRNELPGRTEVGLGLCCEEAARLIIGKKEPVMLEYDDFSSTDDEIILLRDKVISVLQNRKKSILQRIDEMLWLCGASLPKKHMPEWIEKLFGLERLDEEWTRVLCDIKGGIKTADFSGFDSYMKDRQTEYEQLLVYLIYRHFANAPDKEEAAVRAAFAAFVYDFLHAAGAVIWTKNSSFDFSQQVELARLFSSEIEYSDENLYVLFDAL